VAWWRNGYDIGLTVVGSTLDWVAIKWLLLGWVTVCGQVYNVGM